MPRARTTVVLLALVLAVGAIVLWSATRPPAIARLLPEADAIVFADLRPLRLATHFDRNPPPRSADYQHFIDSTGIVPERDLDQAAFALTARPNPAGPDGPVAWTEVLAGRFDPARLAPYLASLSTAQEQYAGHTVFLIPTGDPAAPRTLRVSLLGHSLFSSAHRLVVSNAATAEQLHAVIDRDRAGLLSTAVPALLSDLYPDVPRLSPAWAIGRVGLPLSDPPGPTGRISLFGLALPFPADQPLVVSLRDLGDLRLRIEALAPTHEAAIQQAGALAGLLTIARSLGTAPGAPASPLASVLNSVTITEAGTRTVLSVTIPPSALHALTATAAP